MKQIKEIRQALNRKLIGLKKLKAKVEKSLDKAPEGVLILSSSHGSVQYYYKISSDSKKKYIEKSNTNSKSFKAAPGKGERRCVWGIT